METTQIQVHREWEEWQNQTSRILCECRSLISKSEVKILETVISGPTIARMASMGDDIAREQFRVTVGLICTIAGIKRPPDAIALGILWTYSKDYLRGFTLEDLKLSALMNAGGEYRKRIEHFDSCDVKFISQIMELYLEAKRGAITRAKSLLKPPPPPAPPSPEELYNGLVKYVKDNGGKMPESWAWGQVFQYMDENLMIEETTEARQALYKQQFEKLSVRLDLEAKAMRITAEEFRSRQGRLKEDTQAICRKLMVEKYLVWQ